MESNNLTPSPPEDASVNGAGEVSGQVAKGENITQIGDITDSEVTIGDEIKVQEAPRRPGLYLISQNLTCSIVLSIVIGFVGCLMISGGVGALTSAFPLLWPFGPSPTPFRATQTIPPIPTRTATMSPTPMPTHTPTLTEHTQAQVIKVVDGDTIDVEIDGATYSVRYIGIDCPEPGDWMAAEATQANLELVGGKTVYLEKDVSETDGYDRLLRHVFLADGTFVNAELVRLGYARAVASPPDTKYQRLYEEMEQEARDAGRGIWGATPTPRPPTAVPTSVSAGVLTSPPPAAVRDCSGDIYNRSAFSTHAQVQACM